jgi:hypothetical protein
MILVKGKIFILHIAELQRVKIVLITQLRLYNKLANNLKPTDNILHFRRKLKLFLLQQTFYSVGEYFHV